MIAKKEALRINLGSRDRALPGFRNMDMDPHPGVDYVGDVADLSRFETGSVDALRASHILEHFSHTKTVDVLKEWARVLRGGGILEVAVPDFARAIEIYRKVGLQDWIQNFLMGDQGYRSAYHYALFDESRLRQLLFDAGFSEASRVVNFNISIPGECSRLISNEDYKPVSLNFVAVK